MVELKQILEIRNKLISILDSHDDNSISSRLKLNEIKKMEENIEQIIIKSKDVLPSKLEDWDVLKDYAYELASDWFVTETNIKENESKEDWDDFINSLIHPDVSDDIHMYLRDALIWIKCIRLNPNIVNEIKCYTSVI